MRYYFSLFRLLQIDLVNVVNYLRQYLVSINLLKVPGTIEGYENSHITGLSRIGFGYGLYYLIENEYINEHFIWNWRS